MKLFKKKSLKGRQEINNSTEHLCEDAIEEHDTSSPQNPCQTDVEVGKTRTNVTTRDESFELSPVTRRELILKTHSTENICERGTNGPPASRETLQVGTSINKAHSMSSLKTNNNNNNTTPSDKTTTKMTLLQLAATLKTEPMLIKL